MTGVRFFHAQNRSGASVPTNGLLAWWNFNSNIQISQGTSTAVTTDFSTISITRSSGNARQFVYVASPFVEYRYARTDSPILPTSGGISVCLWLRRDGAGGLRIATGNIDTNSTSAYVSVGFNGSNQAEFRVANVGGSVVDVIGNASTASALSTWEHWVYVISGTSGGTHRVYKNAVEVATMSATFTRSNAFGANWHFNGDTNFWGSFSLDDVMLYNRALSASEVTAIYNATL